MATAGRMATPTDAEILTLTQWFSPAYPVGSFAYSHGLEWAVESRQITDAATTKAWITDVLTHGSGHNDALFLIAAYTAESVEQLLDIDATACAFCPSAERLMETRLLGDAFCATTSGVWGTDPMQLTYPVAVGYAARQQGLPLLLTTRMFLQSFAANLVGCATRLVPLGQTEGQRLIRDLTPLCTQIAKEVQDGDLDRLSATAFMSDIASMRHETQYSRMFRT